ncbi:DUF1254 domain-containing protein [Cupriavidus sp. H18C2]|uniref:DUF1254 domain-containing protein n=1 Tax=Cupriavidus sp. H18C2 TaxID=3241602 RepID=UPI003BF779AD
MKTASRLSKVVLAFLLAAGAIGSATAQDKDKPVIVTDKNFARAMTDFAMQKEVEQGATNTWHHHRKTMALSEQPAPLMNRDTVYSFAVLDGGGDVAITLPKNDGRYMSLHIVNHDHTTYKVFYGPGRYVIPKSKSSDFFYANVRMQINDKDPADVQKVNQFQDELKIEYLEWLQAQRIQGHQLGHEVVRESPGQICRAGAETGREGDDGHLRPPGVAGSA